MTSTVIGSTAVLVVLLFVVALVAAFLALKYIPLEVPFVAFFVAFLAGGLWLNMFALNEMVGTEADGSEDFFIRDPYLWIFGLPILIAVLFLLAAIALVALRWSRKNKEKAAVRRQEEADQQYTTQPDGTVYQPDQAGYTQEEQQPDASTQPVTLHQASDQDYSAHDEQAASQADQAADEDEDTGDDQSGEDKPPVTRRIRKAVSTRS
jgi:hypothetical protein